MLPIFCPLEMLKNLVKFLLISLLVATSMEGAMAQRIYMMGDSHVGSKIYPRKIEEVIQSKYPDIQFSYWYKNGLRFSNFKTNSEYYNRIDAFKPDILILNMGTNEAYTNRYSSSRFEQNLEGFYAGLIKKLPEVKVVFITPYTNKLKVEGGYEINNNNRKVSDEILEFVKTHPNTYAVDINGEVGTKFVNSPKLIRDNVHLTADGYNILGEQVGKSLLEIENLWP